LCGRALWRPRRSSSPRRLIAETRLCETLLMELKAARYAVQLARRQYDAVDPDNRLVASELERRWNVALKKVSELEAKVEQQQSKSRPPPVPEELGNLGVELERVWNAPETDLRLKKRIIRTLIERSSSRSMQSEAKWS
jgi:hypothetical protein